jgi:LysM repeat protein
VAEGENTASEEPLPGERASSPFRAEQVDPDLPRPICRFLSIEAVDGAFIPASRLDTANRCTSNVEPVAQSGRQQELVCLTAAHVNCPRYLRGVLLAGTPAPPPPSRQPIAPAVIGATLVLAAAIAASFGFLAVRGSFSLPVPSPALVAVIAGTSPAPLRSPTVATSTLPTASPTVEPTPAPTPSPAVTPAPSPTPTPSPPAATATPKPTATSDRYAVLTKCPSTPDCWIYVIRAGDNLQSIANWFGVSYSRMIDMNPGLKIPIHAGDHLKIPTPTR